MKPRKTSFLDRTKSNPEEKGKAVNVQFVYFVYLFELRLVIAIMNF